ncbi:HSP20-like chaperone [Gilbertella persicaria]|uniref:HSP20-like chaperone n=1 Tax=Gilbertella persicaria TaxID=101096 RepID=UPI00222090B1|nr:HSP20-like chaperone [Gilbertella persicaria]KAI8087605.1 HSP20-like chaperone [Gilbertella persicaria]
MSLTQRFISDAFRDMQRAMALFDQPLYNTARRSVLSSPGGLTNQLLRYPATDMVEHPDSFELKAELPGFDKEKIKIELADSRTLVLSGEVKEEHATASPTKEPTDKPQEVTDATTTVEGQQLQTTTNEKAVAKQTDSPQWWVKERVQSSFSRAFSFPTPINPESIKASFDNGVLNIVVPKTTEDQAKRINIE